MQAYFEPEQAFSISIPQPVFEISITYKKKHLNAYFVPVGNLSVMLKLSQKLL